jgi:hypothetical protein
VWISECVADVQCGYDLAISPWCQARYLILL